MTQHNSYKELKNMVHNEMNISKEDIREMIQTAVTNEAKWLSQRLITPEMMTVATKEVIRQMVRESIFESYKQEGGFPFKVSQPTLIGQIKAEITSQVKDRLDVRLYDREREGIKAVVICGFPGVGKSHAYRELRNKFKISDSDSSQFSWVSDGEGNKVRNPEFPYNYIFNIESKLYTHDYIFVSSHQEVRDALAEAKIEYIVVTPSVSDKYTYLQRYKDRKSDDTFIKLLDDKWSEFVVSTINDEKAKSVIVLKEGYLTELIEKNEHAKMHGIL